jgi:GAF domain-containing protein
LSTLLALKQRDPAYIISYALLDTQGRNLLDTLASDIGTNESDQEYFKKAIQSPQQPYVSSVIFPEMTDAPVFYISSSVRNADGDVIGVLRVRYSAIVLQQLTSSSSYFLLESKAFGILLDENLLRLADGARPSELFKLIVPPDPATLANLQENRRLPNRPVEDLSVNLPDFAQGVTNRIDQPVFTAKVYPGENDQDQVDQIAVVALKSRPWVVAVAQAPEISEIPIQDQIQDSLLYTIVIGMVVAVGAFGLGHYLTGPITRLTTVAQQISGGDIQAQAAVEAHDEIGQLAEAFNKMTAQLRHLIGSLEDQVQARTTELTLSMEVGQRAAAIREISELLPTITEFIRQQFDLYYTQVYFVDDLGQNLVLQAGTGNVAQELLARHHSLPISKGSIVGRVASEGRAVVVSDAIASEIHKPNPLLPETRSELAIPLIVEEQVIGVLDMQAKQPNTFTEENQTVFEAMGIQLAIAIDSARQWALAQEARQRSEQALRQLTRETWAETLTSRRGEWAFSYDLSAVTPLTATQQNGGVVVPVVVQNQTIGQLSVHPPEGKILSADEQALLSAVSQQLAQKAENIRLFEETQQRATREQIARQIADKIRASRDIEMAMKTAAAELSKALGTAKAVVSLQVADSDDHPKTGE